eukprot:scaffold320439_cov21-Tisochrysis_lutea.AAC.1
MYSTSGSSIPTSCSTGLNNRHTSTYPTSTLHQPLDEWGDAIRELQKNRSTQPDLFCLFTLSIVPRLALGPAQPTQSACCKRTVGHTSVQQLRPVACQSTLTATQGPAALSCQLLLPSFAVAQPAGQAASSRH